jgi:hypothetical protein
MALLGLVDAIFLSQGAARIGFVLAAIVLAALAALGARSASRTDPVLVIGADGVEHRTVGLIPWSDIADGAVAHGPSGPRLEVRVYDETEYLHRLSTLARLLVRLSLRMGHGLISISQGALDTRVVYLHAQIEARAPHALAR